MRNFSLYIDNIQTSWVFINATFSTLIKSSPNSSKYLTDDIVSKVCWLLLVVVVVENRSRSSGFKGNDGYIEVIIFHLNANHTKGVKLLDLAKYCRSIAV